MSFKEKSSKSSISSKKIKASKKSNPTSAEHILDSDVDAESLSDNAVSSIKSDLKTRKEVQHTNGIKRKSTQDSEPSTIKRTKSSPLKERQLTNGAKGADQLSKVSSHLNGSSGGRSRAKSRSSTESARSDSSDSESQKSSEEPPQKLTETPKMDSTSTVARPAKAMTLSDSSSTNDESEKGTESENDQARNPTIMERGEERAALAAPSEHVSKELPPYRPPEGFSIVPSNVQSTEDVRSVLSQENLVGKQLWHITVPASIPLSDVRKVARTQILSGNPILSHKGTQYAFSQDGEFASSSKILIPGQKGNEYQPIGRDIDLHLHLKQSIDLHHLKTGFTQGKQIANPIIGSRKTKLEQPIGLRMRYRPFGDVDDSTNEINASLQAEQRMDNAKIPLPTVPTISPKQAKKSKKSSQGNQAPIEWIDPQAYSAPIVIGEDSQHNIEISSTAPDDNQLNENKHETPEQRAKRKAEKTARKEERRRRKEGQVFS